MPYLPEGIQENILLRLPAKSILRFKSACKRWHALFCSPEFGTDHLSHVTSKANKNPSIIDIYGNGNVIYSVDYDAISSLSAASSSLSLPRRKCNTLVRMGRPLQRGDEVEILGSCNGLVCLKSGRRGRWRLFLLNPATRDYKEVKKQPCYHRDAAYGFGYDSAVHDYKLVRIVNSKVNSKIYVHSLKSDAWRSGHTSTHLFTGKLVPGLLHNGAFHWLGRATQGTTGFIVSFDISTERFVNLPFPEEATSHGKESSLGVLRGSICVVYSDIVRTDLWVMLDYGVGDSWTKLFSSTQIPFIAGSTCLKPVWSFEYGDILIETGTSFFLYDQKKDRVRFLKLWGSDFYMPKSVSYVGSLVSLNSGSGPSGTCFGKKRRTGSTARGHARRR